MTCPIVTLLLSFLILISSIHWHDLYCHSQTGPLEIIVLTRLDGEDKRAGMIDLLRKNKLVCDATFRQRSLESCNFELLLALRCAPGSRMAMSFNWLMETPFVCSPCLCLHTHKLPLTYIHTQLSVSLCVSSLLKHVHEIIPRPKVCSAGPVE